MDHRMLTRDGSAEAVATPPTPPRAARIDVPTLVIQPSRGWIRIDWRELWEYRELLYFFVWRDLKVRYKRTVIGATWAVIQPFFTMVVFSIFFGRLAGMSSDGLPYPVFAYAALVPWMYFANAMTGATNAVVAHSAMISKVYFPRLLLPAVPVLGGLVDLFIALTILAGLLLYYGISPSPALAFLPFFIILALGTAFAVGLWLAALNALFQDVRYAVPFLVQFWLFASPVAYPVTLIPEPWRPLYGLNPMAAVIEGFRWTLLSGARPPDALLAVSVSLVIALCLSGLLFFRRMERHFSDVV